MHVGVQARRVLGCEGGVGVAGLVWWWVVREEAKTGEVPPTDRSFPQIRYEKRSKN